MKSLARKMVLGSRMLRLVADLQSPSAAILMYHSVREDPREVANLLGGIAHSKAVFRGQMELLAREFRPIGLDAITDSLHKKRELPRRSVVVTFDDGYADNHELAMPILDSCGVPATFYVTVDCIETGRLPWPARLRFPFTTSKVTAWRDPSGETWPLADSEGRERAYGRACEICCKLTGKAQDDFVAGVETSLQTGTTKGLGKQMMSNEQMLDLIRHGHLVGSHTISHPNMAQVSRAEAVTELDESKTRLESRLGVRVAHFSYPCPALSPHWNEFTVQESSKAGYETVVTTDRGLVRVGDDPLRLKRVRPTKTVEGLRWNLECAFAGRAV